MATTVLVGLGNPVRGDDGVGLRVAAEVERLLAERPVAGVRVVASTRGGFELIDVLAGADHAVLVDCLETESARPGRVRVLPLDRVAGSARLVGSHDIGLAAAVELGRLLGIDMPAHVEVIGIEADVGNRIEEDLSPEVAAAVPLVASWLHRRLAGAATAWSEDRPGRRG